MLDGRSVALRRPADARGLGIALLTEDRQRDGLLHNLSVGDNITAGNLGMVSTLGVVREPREAKLVADLLTRLRVNASGRAARVQSLSGGNQQKLLLARVLTSPPRILLLDEPTKGVDVAVREEIYALIHEIARKGVAVIVVSSDLDEVFRVADRCITLTDGRITDAFDAAAGTMQRVLAPRGTSTSAETGSS
jgi:ABC-type sugar transport system ATPase subunit